MKSTNLKVSLERIWNKKFTWVLWLYVQSNTLPSANVHERFLNKTIKISELDHALFLSALGLTWQAALKKVKSSIGTVNRCWYVTNGKESYQRLNIACYASISKT